MFKKWMIGLLLPLALARAAEFSLPDMEQTFPAGTVTQVPLNTVIAEGEDVLAIELDLQFPSNWEVMGVLTSGGLLEGWTADWQAQPDGRNLHLAIAGSQELFGSGELLQVEVAVTSSGWMNFTTAAINEGVEATIDNGYFTHHLPQTLGLSPFGTQSMLVGESLQYTVSGTNDPPLVWNVENTATGSIDGSGLFTAIAQGSNHVLVEDAIGRSGISGEIQIHSFGLSGGTGSTTAGLPVNMPVQLENPGGLEIMAFECVIDLESTRLSLDALELEGTLLQGWTDIFAQQSGNLLTITGAASQANAITGSGELLQLRLNTTIGSGLTITPDIDLALFNEELTARRSSATITLASTGNFSVTPNTAYLKRGETQQMSWTGNPNGTPLVWSVTNPAVASINADGLLTALAGGWTKVVAVDPIGVRDTSSVIDVYDLDIQPGLADAPAGGLCRLPIVCDSLLGFDVMSWELELHIDTTRFEFLGLELDSTLSESWSQVLVEDDGANLTMAGAGPALPEDGNVLVRLLLQVADDVPVGGTSLIQLNMARMNESSPLLSPANRLLVFSEGTDFEILPDTALIKRGQTQQMSWSGSPMLPLSWSTLDPAVATIDGDGLLTAVAGGSTQVVAVDPMGVSDTSGVMAVYDLDIQPGPAAAPIGQLCRLPIICDSLEGFSVTEWELVIDLDESLFDFASLEFDSTLSEGWSASTIDVSGGTITLSASGSALPVVGNVLVRLLLTVADDAPLGESSLIQLSHATMNAGSPVLEPADRLLTFSEAGSFSITPDTALIKRGQTQQLSWTGMPNGLPLLWSTLDPTVATIDADGLLTALAGGSTRVVAVDQLGVSDTSGVFAIYDLDIQPGLAPAPVGQVCRLPIVCDSLEGFSVTEWELELVVDSSLLSYADFEFDTTLSEGWASPVVEQTGDTLRLSASGPALPVTGTVLARLLFNVSAAANIGDTSMIQLTEAGMNAGSPVLHPQDRLITFTEPDLSVVEDEAQLVGFKLGKAWPNPFNPVVNIPFSLEKAGEARLAVYDLLGREQALLVSGWLQAGEHLVSWQGQSSRGAGLASGMYFLKLESAGKAQVEAITYLR
jgi:uncharacterized protein YjdB